MVFLNGLVVMCGFGLLHRDWHAVPPLGYVSSLGLAFIATAFHNYASGGSK